MKVIMIYDQIQAGAGIKDDHMVPLGGKKEAVGPAIMMEPYLKAAGGRVIACLYCGDGFFEADPQEVSRKFCAMAAKLKPDVVMCGPAFNYLGYGRMAARVAKDIMETTGIPAFDAMSQENQETIDEYKNQIHIVRTPKKGGTGLNEALEGMCILAKAMTEKKGEAEAAAKYCF